VPITTPADRVRLLISDTAKPPLFSDDEIAAFLDLNAGTVRLAAADALDTIASNEALVSRKITTQDLSTDGPAVSRELRARAADLRARHSNEVASTGTGDGAAVVVDLPMRWWG
jgi:hypothetical protein